MVRLVETIEIDAPADDVWRVAGRPERIEEFHPFVARATVSRDVRTCVLTDGTKLVERIVDRSEAHRFYTYTLTSARPSRGGYRACLAVRGHGHHSHVDWDVELQDGDDALVAAGGVHAVLRIALERLRDRLEGDRRALVHHR